MGKKLEVKADMSRAQLASYLRDLAGTLEAGKICIQDGDSYVTLTPSDELSLEFSAAQKPEKGKFELSVSWKVQTEEKRDISLVISGNEPEVADISSGPDTGEG